MPFQKGKPSANPLGAGAQMHRRRLQTRFDADILKDYEKYGAHTIIRVREEFPAKYLEIVLSRMPKDPVDVAVKHTGFIEHIDLQAAAEQLVLILRADTERAEARALPDRSVLVALA